MTTSSYMPDVTCEIAFDGGFRVPMADWTWTDVSDYVELADGVTITGGRGDERSTCDANTLTLTLDNSDGRFTADRVTSPYYPNVVLYKPIRVLADPVDGAQSERFTGYITFWPVEWNETSAYAKATITAASRLARLGLNAEWRSLVEETLLYDSPLAYYPLGEPEDATLAADVSGNGAPPLALVGDPTLPVVFGQATGPPTDDLTAATFAGGQYLSAPGAVSIPAGPFSVEFFFNTTARADLVRLRDHAGVSLVVSVEATGEVNATYDSATLASSSTYIDGATHHVVVTHDGGTAFRLYVNGVEVDSAAAADSHTTLSELAVGPSASASLVIAHVAVFDTELSPTRVAAHDAAGVDGWAGDLTDERLVRYAEMAGIPTAEVDADAGTVTMTHVDTTGTNVVDMLRLVEITEGGVLFDGRDGLLTLHNRSRRYAAASSFTLDMALDEVEADYSPRLDASMLVNDATVTSPITSARKTDAQSILDKGVATASVSIAAEDPDQPLQVASWAVYLFKDPRLRAPSLSVNALAQVGKTVTCAQILAATIGDKVSVANHPAQAPFSIVDYFIEGWTETYGPESLTVTWNVSPSSPDDTTLILSDATRGFLGTNPLAF